MDGGHWYDRLPPLLLVMVALVLIAVRVGTGSALDALVGLAGVLIGAAVVLEAKRNGSG